MEKEATKSAPALGEVLEDKPKLKSYRVLIQAANTKLLVYPKVEAVNDLSIGLLCMSFATAMHPRVASIKILDFDDGRVVADCAVLDFAAAVASDLAKATGEQIMSMVQLQKGQAEDFEGFMKQEQEKARKQKEASKEGGGKTADEK